MVYSVFENRVFKNDEWDKDTSFYLGKIDISKIDFNTDWRFSEITGKRTKSVLKGYCMTSFPVKHPIKFI